VQNFIKKKKLVNIHPGSCGKKKKKAAKSSLRSFDINITKSQSFTTTQINNYHKSKTTLIYPQYIQKACVFELIAVCNK
jgi:hypothetical protein